MQPSRAVSVQNWDENLCAQTDRAKATQLGEWHQRLDPSEDGVAEPGHLRDSVTAQV
jgi:hypothetical protein